MATAPRLSNYARIAFATPDDIPQETDRVPSPGLVLWLDTWVAIPVTAVLWLLLFCLATGVL